jgi:hypothetical protein
MTHILAVALMAAMGAQQTGSVPPYNPNPPQVPPAYQDSTETSTAGATIVSITDDIRAFSFRTPTVVINFTEGPLMVGNDEKGQIVFTLFRDGHVEYTDKRAMTDSLKFFWKTMADSYSEILKTACPTQKGAQ